MEITGVIWIIIVIAIICFLSLFLWCCLKINDMYEDDNK